VIVELRAPGAVVRIAPAEGGRIVSFVASDQERILPKSGAGRLEPPIGWGCFAMVPWAGRLSNGRIPTSDGEVRLEANLGPSSIHGLGFDAPWAIATRGATQVTMRCDLRGRGWPFGGDATQTLTLGPSGLDFDLEVGGYTRAGPAGLGWHPWFMRPNRGDLEVELDAAKVLVVDADLVPTGEIRDVTGDEDLRSGPELGDRRLDHVYVDATSPAMVRWPDLELRIEFDPSLSTVVVHTPAEGICVEPQTMWPNAPVLASRGVMHTGLHTLEPGERMRSHQRWTWAARAGSPTRLR
jgi:aldose 1-epimerase